jgi:hypothetical protein
VGPSLLLAPLVIAFPVSAQRDPAPIPPLGEVVIDTTGTLTDSQRDELERRIWRPEHGRGGQLQNTRGPVYRGTGSIIEVVRSSGAFCGRFPSSHSQRSPGTTWRRFCSWFNRP